MASDRRYEVRITPDAIADLEAIHDYLAEQRSPDFADEWLDRILEHIGKLEVFPDRGTVPKELELVNRRHYRQISMRPYRILYRIVGDAVVIGLIADGRRDMQTLLGQRLLSR